MSAEDDVDTVVDDLHRFASRCMTAGEHQMMMTVMCNILRRPGRTIRQVLIINGARLDPNDVEYLFSACECGMRDIVQHAIDGDAVIENRHLVAAVSSGDIETVIMVFNHLGTSRRPLDSSTVCFGDFDIYYCNLLLQLGVLQPHTHYAMYRIRSVSVLQCFLDHDMIDMQRIVRNIAAIAVEQRGSCCMDALQYLVEVAQLPVHHDILIHMYLREDKYIKLDVVDFLLCHGADVNAADGHGNNMGTIAPMYMRYWIDNGITINNPRALFVNTIRNRRPHQIEILIVIMNVLPFDLNQRDESGRTVLREILDFDDYVDISLLLEHGADVNARHVGGDTPLHTACKSHGKVSLVSQLVKYGADVNAKNDDYKTPYELLCELEILS